MRRFFILAAALVCIAAGAHAETPAQRLLLSNSNGATLTLNFLTGSLPSHVVATRSSAATTALYTDAAAATVTSYGSGVPRIEARGFLIEQSVTNYLLNSAAPVTQTTGSLGTGTYSFFCNGTGSVTSIAGTATASGLGALTCSLGTWQTINVSVAGTLIFTVSGSVNWFDLQNLGIPTSHIVTAGVTVARAADVATVPTSAFNYSSVASTIVAQVRQNAILAGGTTPQQIIEIDDGTSNNWVQVYFRSAASNFTRNITVSGTGVVATDAGTALGVGVVQKVGYSWQVGGASLYANNVLVGHDTPASIPVVTTLRLGFRVSGIQYLNGWLLNEVYYNKRLSDAQLQSLTH